MLIHFSELVCVKWGGGSGAGAGELSGKNVAFAIGESGIVGSKGFGVFIGYEIALWRRVGALNAAEVAGNQLLCEKVGHFAVARFGVIVYLQLRGKTKSGVAVEVDVAFHANRSDTHCTSLVECILKQFFR